MLVACSRTPTPTTDVPQAPASTTGSTATIATSAPLTPSSSPPLPKDATPCASAPIDGGRTLDCFRFASTEDAFKWVLAHDPQILAIGEAHAQKGTEVASTTKRFTDTLLPIVAPRASDVVVELWAPDPKCQKEVTAVASAQKPVTTTQASTNQNEYVTLGTRSKELGMTPWLLRPTCDDFTTLANAGEDAVGKMLGLVKRLTQQKLVQLWERAKGQAGDAGASKPKMVLAYGGAMHNDLFPAPETKEWSFGPELATATTDGYVELDLIVPELVKDTATWQKLPWYAPHKADPGPKDRATLYRNGARSFTIMLTGAR